MKTLDVYAGYGLLWLLILVLFGVFGWWAWDELQTLIQTVDALV